MSKTFSSDLLVLFKAAGSTVLASTESSLPPPIERTDLYKIGPCLNGEYIYANNSDLPVTYGGNVYEPVAYGRWKRGDITVAIGLSANELKMTVYTDEQVPIYFPGTTDMEFLDGIKYGLLGNAPVYIYTLYNSDYVSGYEFPTTTGPNSGNLVETKFVGMVTDIEKLFPTSCQLSVKDELYLLNRQIPHRVFQSECDHVLYDTGCTLTASTYMKTGTVSAVTDSTTNGYIFTTTAHITPASSSSSGTFAQGRLVWTSGDNDGLTCFVRAWTSGTSSDTIQLDVQGVFPIAAGDTFNIYEGCTHTFARCVVFQGSTNARKNFGGQPYVPVPETAIG